MDGRQYCRKTSEGSEEWYRGLRRRREGAEIDSDSEEMRRRIGNQVDSSAGELEDKYSDVYIQGNMYDVIKESATQQ